MLIFSLNSEDVGGMRTTKQHFSKTKLGSKSFCGLDLIATAEHFDLSEEIKSTVSCKKCMREAIKLSEK